MKLFKAVNNNFLSDIDTKNKYITLISPLAIGHIARALLL